MLSICVHQLWKCNRVGSGVTDSGGDSLIKTSPESYQTTKGHRSIGETLSFKTK